jgi:hypothetical protein
MSRSMSDVLGKCSSSAASVLFMLSVLLAAQTPQRPVAPQTPTAATTPTHGHGFVPH